MKVLFAVSNESISEAIIKKYQQMYKEIISSKNVYYFNAIIKELQKDKSYDRIVISEDLEPFASKNYDTIDNFLFEKLDSISDEASNVQGEDIPIILISTDRRTKGESLLVKLFGIGVYSALIGQDRSIEQVCNLINKPRSKKEAKVYYKISSGEVEYKAESEGDVSEVEIQNILAHYKRLGKNEEKYVTSFNSIANQYTDQQLRLIIKFLPLNVKAVLEAQCPRYQQVVAYSGGTVDDEETEKEYKNTQSKFSKKHEKQHKVDKQAEKAGLKIESIKTDKNSSVLSKPVIIPSEVTTRNIKKVEQKGNNMTNSKQNEENQAENLQKNGRLQEPHRIIKSNNDRQQRAIIKNNQMQEQPIDKKQNNQMQEQQRDMRQNSQMQEQQRNMRQNGQMQEQQRNMKENNQMQEQQTNIRQNGQMQQQRNMKQNGQMQGQQRNMKENSQMQEQQKNMNQNSQMQEQQRNMNQNSQMQEQQRNMNQNSQMQEQQKNINQNSQIQEQETHKNVMQNIEIQETPVVQEQPKRGRGRPRKVLTEEEIAAQANVVKRKRGRPRKIQVEDEIEQQNDVNSQINESTLPSFEDYQTQGNNSSQKNEMENDDILSGFESFEDPNNDTLPGFEDFEENTNNELETNSNNTGMLPGFDDYNEQSDTDMLPGFNDFNNEKEYDDNMFSDFEDDGMLPGMEGEYTKKDGMIPVASENEQDNILPSVDDYEEKDDKLSKNNYNQSDDMFLGMNNYEENNDVLPGMNNYEENNDVLPGMNNYEENSDVLPGMNNYEENNDVLPGMNNYEENNYNQNDDILGMNSYEEDNNMLSGMDKYQNNISASNSIGNDNYSGIDNFDLNTTISNYENQTNNDNFSQQIQTQNINTNIGTESLLSGDKKIVGFVGTSKNGTSFIVDNLAQMLSNQGIKTAILDLTQNRNAYYIYTKNEENLRRIAIDCMKNLELGIANGIKVNPNLDVYTSLPGELDEVENVNNVITTLTQKYSLILVDCDFKSDYRYIANLQELYLVQSMDVLTIQPLTAYLRDLKAKGILDQSKLRVVINKYLRVRSLTEKTIIGGMAFYNDPAMSFMTELFNRETIKYTVIPFDTQAYSKYLEGLVNCEISLNGYSKEMIAELRKLANMVYPLVTNTQKYGKEYNKKQKAQYGQYQKNFSNEMNNTLNKMKNNY